MKTVYIKCPPRLVTGGPEFLHQVCKGLRDNDVDARMLYETYEPFPQADVYTARYNNPWEREVNEKIASTLIVPEIDVLSLFGNKYKKINKCILWESVNFYLSQIQAPLLNFFPQNTFHLCPTQYANEYLNFAKIPKEQRLTVTDYISEEFLNLKNQTIDNSKKENLITFYALKGNEFTDKIILDLAEKYNYTYLSLKNYSTEELIKILSKSKIFLDFSYFPGKNKMHREASVCNNIIFTSTMGAAKYKNDVNIPDKYKFDIKEANLEIVKNEIKDCIDNFEERLKDFDEHREEAFREKEIFDRNIKVLAEKIKKEFEF